MCVSVCLLPSRPLSAGFITVTGAELTDHQCAVSSGHLALDRARVPNLEFYRPFDVLTAKLGSSLVAGWPLPAMRAKPRALPSTADLDALRLDTPGKVIVNKIMDTTLQLDSVSDVSSVCLCT